MEQISLDDIANIPNRPSDTARNVASALDTTDVGIRYYELEPGELVGRTYHRHMDQEEIFHVTSGAVTFEIGGENGPTDEIVVEVGDWIRFAPGDWQRGRNRGETRATVIGIGAPKGMSLDAATRLRHCPDCDAWTEQDITTDAGEGVSTCRDCGTETGRWA